MRHHGTRLLLLVLCSAHASADARDTAASDKVNVIEAEAAMDEADLRESRGIFDDMTSAVTGLFSFGGSSSASANSEESVQNGGLSLVPNHCWYRGDKFECSLSITCAIKGKTGKY